MTAADQTDQTDQPDRAAEVRAALEHYLAVRERLDRGEGDWAEYAELFTEDAVFVDVAWGRVEGRDAIAQLFAEAMSGLDFTFPVDFSAVDGDWILVQWRQVLPGTRPDGRPYEQSAVSTIRYGGDGLFDYQEDVLNVVHTMEDIVESGWQPGPGFTDPPPHPNRDFRPPPR